MKEYYSEKLNQRFQFPDDISLSEVQKFVDKKEGVSSPTPVEQRTAGQQFAQLPLGIAEGAASGIPGLPVDALNLGISGVNKVAGLNVPHIPIGGSDWIKQLLQSGENAAGFRPAQTGTEKNLRDLGQSMGGMLGAPEFALAKMPRLLQLLLGGTGSKVRDALVGATSWGGKKAGEVVANAAPQSGIAQTAPTIGALIGGMGPAAVESSVAKHLKQGGVLPLSQEGKALKENFAQEGIHPSAYTLAPSEISQKAEHAPLYSLLGAQGIREHAGKEMQEGEQALHRALGSVPSVPAGQEEAIGKTTVQHLQGVGDREAAQSLQSAQGLHTAPGVGPGHDAVALGRLAQGEFQTAFDRFKKGNKEFDRIEKYTGDEPVIHLNDYANAGADISQNKAATGIPPGAKAYGPDVKPLTEEEWSMEKFRKPYTNLSPTEKGHVDSLVRHASGVGGAGLVPFWVARRIQSKLGEVGWSGGAPIGSIGQGEARRLYVAISRDIDESFLTNRLDKFPNMPQELQNAKNAYKNGIQLFNRSIVRHLFPNRSDPTSPQKFVDALNHGNPTRLSYVMSHASPDLQEGIRGHILANWYKKATPFNQPFNFEESQFLKEVEPWYRDGRIDTLFPSGTQSRRQLDQLVTDFTQTASTPRAQKIDTIRRSLENQDPRFVHQYVLDPKHPQRTQQFFATADPATRQNLVRVWASDFQKDIQTALPYGRPGSPKVARPSKIYNTLSALEKTGQLDVMFQDFPGVADHLKKQIPLFEALQRAEKTATRQQQFGTWAALGQAAVGLHSLWNIAKGIATGSPGKIARGVGEGFAEVFPSAWTKAIHTEKGVRILSEGLNKVYGPAATGFAARILGAGGANTQSSPTQPPPAPQRAPTPSAPASSSPTAVKTPVKPPMSTEQRGALDSIFR